MVSDVVNLHPYIAEGAGGGAVALDAATNKAETPQLFVPRYTLRAGRPYAARLDVVFAGDAAVRRCRLTSG